MLRIIFFLHSAPCCEPWTGLAKKWRIKHVARLTPAQRFHAAARVGCPNGPGQVQAFRKDVPRDARNDSDQKTSRQIFVVTASEGKEKSRRTKQSRVEGRTSRVIRFPPRWGEGDRRGGK